MTKQQWIKSQAQYLNITNPNDLWSHLLTTQVEVENTSPEATIPKPLSILEFAASLDPNDRRLMQNEGAYQSLITNINKGDLPSAQADIQNLITTPQLSQDAIGVLNAALIATTETIPAPRQPTAKVPMYVAAGYAELTLGEVIEAIGKQL